MSWRVNNGSYLFLFLVVPLAQVPLKEVPCSLSLAKVWQSQFVGDRYLGGSFWPRNQDLVSCIAGRFFTNWAIKEAHIYIHTHTDRHTHTHLSLSLSLYLSILRIILSLVPFLWRLKNSTISWLQATNPGEPVLWFSHTLKACEEWVVVVWIQVEEKEKTRRLLLSPSISSSEIGKKGNNFSFLCLLFHSDPQQIEWCLPTPMCGLPPQGRPSISLSHPFKCSSHPETPSQIQPEIIFNLDAPWPGKVACKISRHSG